MTMWYYGAFQLIFARMMWHWNGCPLQIFTWVSQLETYHILRTYWRYKEKIWLILKSLFVNSKANYIQVCLWIALSAHMKHQQRYQQLSSNRSWKHFCKLRKLCHNHFQLLYQRIRNTNNGNGTNNYQTDLGNIVSNWYHNHCLCSRNWDTAFYWLLCLICLQ